MFFACEVLVELVERKGGLKRALVCGRFGLLCTVEESSHILICGNHLLIGCLGV